MRGPLLCQTFPAGFPLFLSLVSASYDVLSSAGSVLTLRLHSQRVEVAVWIGVTSAFFYRPCSREPSAQVALSGKEGLLHQTRVWSPASWVWGDIVQGSVQSAYQPASLERLSEPPGASIVGREREEASLSRACLRTRSDAERPHLGRVLPTADRPRPRAYPPPALPSPCGAGPN